MESFNNNQKIKKMILLSNLTAFAIVLGLIESRLELIAVPGAKLGLANLVSLVVLYLYSYKEALIITITRVILVGVLSGNLGPTFWMGLSGGLVSVLCMSLLKKMKLSTTVVSLFGSITHQIGQVAIGMKVLGANEIFMYLYIMIPLGIISGIVIGLIAERFLIHYERKNNIE